MSYRKIHHSGIVSLAILLVITLLVLELCKTDFCYYTFEVSFGEAIFWGGSVLMGILLFLRIFSSRVFELWLKYIASWVIPVVVIIVLYINPSSGGILSVDRGPAALQLMALLGVITAFFAIGYTAIARLRK